MKFDEIIEARHTVREFKKGKKPDYKDILEVVNCASKGPLAGNQPCLKYVIVTEKDKIKQLAEAAQQNFIADIEYCIVVCSDKKFLKKSFYDRADIYSRQQAGAAIMTMLLKITELGLASCWVGAFAEDTVKRAIGIPADLDVEAILPIGYEMGKPKKKTKPNLDSILFFNGYGFTAKHLDKRTMVAGSKT